MMRGVIFRVMKKRLIFVWMFIFLVCMTASGVERMTDQGGFPPLLSVFDGLNAPGLESVRFAGPLGGYESDTMGYDVRVSPLFALRKRGERVNGGSLWPLSVYRRDGEGAYLRILLYYHFFQKYPNGYDTLGMTPLFFYGHTRDSECYGALFPLGGNLRDFLGYDRIRFVLFPLWLSTSKGAVSGTSYCWPFVGGESGGKTDRFRIFPFYGYSRMEGQSLSRFYGFPFVTCSESLRPDHPASAWMVWPFAGHAVSRSESAMTALYPFFLYQTRFPDSRIAGDDGGVKCHLVWPVFQYSRGIARPSVLMPGEAETADSRMGGHEDFKCCVWPLYGEFERRNSSGRYILWPLCWNYHYRGARTEIRQRWVLPLYWQRAECDQKTKTRVSIYRHFWPICAYRVSEEGALYRVLALWPELESSVIDRYYAPLWTLFTHRREGRSVRTDCLWGMFSFYRDEAGTCRTAVPFFEMTRSAAGTVSGCALAGGIFDWQDDGKEKRVKLLWFIEF